MTGDSKRSYRPRIKDVNAPRRPTTAFNFYMKLNSADYLQKFKDVPLNDVIKMMSAEWHKLDPEARKPYDEAAAVAREEYEKELERYRKTEAYKSFEKLKSDVRHGLLDSSEIKKQQKGTKKTGGTASLKPQSKKQFKLGFEVFSDTFKEFNRRREDEIRKLRKNANKLEEEIEDIEDKIDEIQKKKTKLAAEQSESQMIEKRCKETLERYRSTILTGMTERTLEQFGLTKNATTKEVIAVLSDIKKNPTLSQQLKRQIEGLRFN